MALVTILFGVLFSFVLILSYFLFLKNSSNLLIAAILFIIVFLILLAFTSYNSLIVLDTYSTDYTKIGPYGDYIGGVLNPLISVFAVFAAGFAFYAQYQANKQVQDQFQIQQFESQLFEMINLYRKNADEMKLSNYNGRKCFAVMFEEFKFIYLEVETYLSEHDLNEKDLTSISYCIFYYGVGNNIKPILNQLYNKLKIDFNELIYRLEMVKNEFDYHGHVTLTNNLGDSISYIFKYKPFKGHLSRLGHYYRHLFQTVKYVINNKNIHYDKKYEYLKLIRCQISDYEYIFLFYNSLFEKGNEWLVLNIFSEYRFIKNIPLELLNFGVNPKELFELKNSRNEKIFE